MLCLLIEVRRILVTECSPECGPIVFTDSTPGQFAIGNPLQSPFNWYLKSLIRCLEFKLQSADDLKAGLEAGFDRFDEALLCN